MRGQNRPPFPPGGSYLVRDFVRHAYDLLPLLRRLIAREHAEWSRTTRPAPVATATG